MAELTAKTGKIGVYRALLEEKAECLRDKSRTDQGVTASETTVLAGSTAKYYKGRRVTEYDSI